jgi:type VI protein secretion system component VasF
VSESQDRVARRRRRRRRVPAWALIAAGLLVAFVVGIAVGEALHDNPEPGGTQTLVRTLQPLPLEPAPGSTVTVTVRNTP